MWRSGGPFSTAFDTVLRPHRGAAAGLARCGTEGAGPGVPTLYKPVPQAARSDPQFHDLAAFLPSRSRFLFPPLTLSGRSPRRVCLLSKGSWRTVRDDKLRAMSPADIANRLWNYCHFTEADGMNYGDYVERRF